MDTQRAQEALRKKFLAVRDMYRDSVSVFVNILAMGDYGTGKTSLYATCPFPCHVDSFDPGGTKTAVLQPFIDSGDILVDNRFEVDSWKDPVAFALWETNFELRRREGYFDALGTYGIDSTTMWGKSLMFEMLKRGGNQSATGAGNIPQQRDYLLQQLNAGSILSKVMDLPCHVLITGHIAKIKNEVTGGMETGLMLWGKMADQVPLIFDEKYIMRVVPTAKGPKYKMQVKSDGIYKAETRMGGSKFSTFMEPNIRKLLKQTSKSYEDKPKLF